MLAWIKTQAQNVYNSIWTHVAVAVASAAAVYYELASKVTGLFH